ncbi:Stk1 family PASTA domain-containing Ser/Thr kinase, partial [Streptomyces prunicolor]
ADDMRIDIEACLDGQPVAATAALGSVGYGGYGDDMPTTALRSDAGAGATTMLPPMNPDDGGFGYDDRPDRRRQQKKKSNTSTILLVVAAVLVLVGAILIGKWAFSGDGGADKPFAAPNFVGQTYDTAKTMAVNSGLKLAEPTRKACENAPKGSVCSQDPKEGTDVHKGDTVKLVVSTGAPKVVVPSVVGQSVDDATTTLEGDKYKFVVKTQQKVSGEDPGTVLEQNPALGAEVQKGTTITLTVAKAQEKSTVPDVSGQSCDDAKKQMQQNNLVGNCTEVATTDTNLNGKVVTTTPSAGTQVDKNSSVNIQIGKVSQTQVPNVVNQTVANAKQILQQNGFTNIQFSDNSDQGDNAIVIQQDPGSGNQVDDPGNTQITLTTVGTGNGNNGGSGFLGGNNG